MHRRRICLLPSSRVCRKPRKTLPCRYFYDARGSELFEEITRLPEYYPTRTEAAILAAHAAEIADGIDDGGAARRIRLGLEPQDGNPARIASRRASPTFRSMFRKRRLTEAQARLDATLSGRSTCDRSSAISRDPSHCLPISRHGAKTGFFPGSTHRQSGAEGCAEPARAIWSRAGARRAAHHRHRSEEGRAHARQRL